MTPMAARLTTAALALAALAGCTAIRSQDLPAIIKELAADPATIHFKIDVSITGGSVVFDRMNNNPARQTAADAPR